MTSSREPVERYDQLPVELKNRIADLGAPTFIQLAELVALGGVATAIVQYLPNQRVDRVAVFVAELARRLDEVAANLAKLEVDLNAGSAPERARLLRDAASAAEKAVSDQRAARIARIASVGLASGELAAQRARSFLSLLENLTDVELAVLAFFQREHRHIDAWRPLSTQLSASPSLARIFESDVAYWIACVSKLEASGLLRRSTVWGGEPEGDRSQTDVDRMMHRVDLYSLMTLGHELVAIVELSRTDGMG
ncbi:MAG: hypothetical protein A4S17_13065 [Proteobacteria bacterium HN_bin10]|nr:MAG: hypothetical protein A4S17_13065 [Proteobacteria bacterium HN_bin10]